MDHTYDGYYRNCTKRNGAIGCKKIIEECPSCKKSGQRCSDTSYWHIAICFAGQGGSHLLPAQGHCKKGPASGETRLAPCFAQSLLPLLLGSCPATCFSMASTFSSSLSVSSMAEDHPIWHHFSYDYFGCRGLRHWTDQLKSFSIQNEGLFVSRLAWSMPQCIPSCAIR